MIGPDNPSEDEHQQDAEDVTSLYDLLESKIVPLYYDRDARDLPPGWIAMMKASIATLTPRFSASRMVGDYVENAYMPAAERGVVG